MLDPQTGWRLAFQLAGKPLPRRLGRAHRPNRLKAGSARPEAALGFGAMPKLNLLRSIMGDVKKKHRCHTLILYGSWARGDATAASDYDLLAIQDHSDKVVRDARQWKGIYLDIFVYPEKSLRPADLLTVRGGKVLFQKNRIGATLLASIDKVFARGPKPLSSDELWARKVWARKMVDRARSCDPEGNFRRVWLLTALLEDYFLFQHRWYEGPKAAFKWLRENQPEVGAQFERALEPGADLSAISDLVETVVAAAPHC
jgi:hypothetical protein